MNGLTKQIVINKVIEEVDEARGNAEHGQLLDPCLLYTSRCV